MKYHNLATLYSLLIAFRLLLEVSYEIVAKEYFYAGFQVDISIGNYLVSWLLYISVFFSVRKNMDKVSDYFFMTAALSIAAPLTVIYGYDQTRNIAPVVSTCLAITMIAFIVNIKGRKTRVPYVKNGKKIAIAISSFFVIFLAIWYVKSGVNLNLSLSKVYEFRSENTDLSGGLLLNYTNGWTYKVFSICLMTLALMHQRFFMFLIIFLFQVFFFAASAHKSVLFYPFLVLGAWFYFSKTRSTAIMPLAFSVVIIFTITAYYLFDQILYTSLFSRRVFFVPANLTYAYFDFFAEAKNVYWSNSLLSSLIEYPYGETSIPKVIGAYLGRDGMAANNGLVASGFSHAGYTGIAIYAAIVGLLLRVINSITRSGLPVWVAIALCVVPLRSMLLSSDLTTVMLTHGLSVAIIMLILVREANGKEKDCAHNYGTPSARHQDIS